jgi:uncharacterized membrane protein
MTTLKPGWILCAISATVSLITLQTIPAGLELPLHFGFDGQADRYGPAWVALFMSPAVIAILLGFFSSLKWLEPRKENLQQSICARNGILFAFILMMLLIQAGNVAIAFGREVSMDRLIIFAIGLALIITGNFLGRIRSNFFIGIRTPWTLSSDEVWRKTHHLGSKLIMLAGFILLIGSWILMQHELIYLLLSSILPAILIPVLYSWWLWHQNA